jgi:hypothetical protein
MKIPDSCFSTACYDTKYEDCLARALDLWEPRRLWCTIFYPLLRWHSLPYKLAQTSHASQEPKILLAQIWPGCCWLWDWTLDLYKSSCLDEWPFPSGETRHRSLPTPWWP